MDKSQARATLVIDAISELMAAHEAAWHRGASLEGAKAVRVKAIAALTDALRCAGKVDVEPD